ncbi:MAG: RNA polymerase sigma factor [Opitutaceae bacterium]
MDSPRSEDAAPPAAALRAWFAEEVHPHDASLKTYLRGQFPSVRDVEDVVQESYLRIWRARAAHPVRSARAFLFQVARHLALDTVRRDRVTPFVAVKDFEGLTVLASGPDAAEQASVLERFHLLADAIESLPRRCREVVILRKLQSVPQRDVAARLGISEKTVEVQLARGIARCEDYLRKRGVRGWYGE